MSRRQKIDEGRVATELSESLFFKRPGVTDGQQGEQKGAAQPVAEAPTEPSSSPEKERTPVRPSVRTLTRMPFEIYRDQHATLKKFSLEEQAEGGRGSMSQMVREAIDMYINKRLNGQQ